MAQVTKTETTQDEITTRYSSVLSVGKKDLRHLLHFQEPRFCVKSSGVWTTDVYIIDGTAITAGPLFFGKIPDQWSVSRYDKKAKLLLKDRELSEKQVMEQINKLLIQFLKTEGRYQTNVK